MAGHWRRGTTEGGARIQNESVTLVRSYYRSYYELNFVGVYSVVAKRVNSVSGYTAVFKIKGQWTLCTDLRALVPFWVIRCSRYSR